VLQRLHDELPEDHFTLGWLMGNLRERSFGIVILLFGLAAVAPGVSVAAGLLLVIPASQMILGHAAPFFPRRIADHPFPARHLAALVLRIVPMLRHLEKMIHPRWRSVLDASGHLVGVMVVIMCASLVLIPIPASNVVPALVIVLISLAWLEEDGLLLVIAMLAGLVVSARAICPVRPPAAFPQTTRGRCIGARDRNARCRQRRRSNQPRVPAGGAFRMARGAPGELTIATNRSLVVLTKAAAWWPARANARRKRPGGDNRRVFKCDSACEHGDD
jgi:hypothetical protein